MSAVSVAPAAHSGSATHTERGWIQLAGWAGVATVILDVVGMAFNFAAGQPPDYAAASKFAAYVRDGGMQLILAGLLFTLSFTIGMTFVVGIRDLITSAGGIWRSVGNLFLVANAVAYAVGYVGIGLLFASVTEARTAGDPAVVRALWGGGFSTLGAVNYAELSFGAALYAIAVGRTRILPRWTGWLAWIAAVGGGAGIPAVFGGTGFYSQLGPATLITGLLPALVWSLSAGICMIRRPAV